MHANETFRVCAVVRSAGSLRYPDDHRTLHLYTQPSEKRRSIRITLQVVGAPFPLHRHVWCVAPNGIGDRSMPPCLQQTARIATIRPRSGVRVGHISTFPCGGLPPTDDTPIASLIGELMKSGNFTENLEVGEIRI